MELCLAEADLASCLQMGVELCLAEADLASYLQMGVELCLAEADLASCLQMGCRGRFGLLCTDGCGAMPFRFLLKEKQPFLSCIALLNEL